MRGTSKSTIYIIRRTQMNSIKSLSQLIELFQEYNEKRGLEYGDSPSNKERIKAVIVFTEDTFTRQYNETSRSYRVDNFSGKAFFKGMLGNSIFGDCLDGSDQGVRLDWYMGDGWKVDYCYLEKENG